MTTCCEWFDANITNAAYNNCRILTFDINYECDNDGSQKYIHGITVLTAILVSRSLRYPRPLRWLISTVILADEFSSSIYWKHSHTLIYCIHVFTVLWVIVLFTYHLHNWRIRYLFDFFHRCFGFSLTILSRWISFYEFLNELLFYKSLLYLSHL